MSNLDDAIAQLMAETQASEPKPAEVPLSSDPDALPLGASEPESVDPYAELAAKIAAAPLDFSPWDDPKKRIDYHADPISERRN